MTMLVPIASPADVDGPFAGLGGEQAIQSDLYLRLAFGADPNPLAGICAHES